MPFHGSLDLYHTGLYIRVKSTYNANCKLAHKKGGLCQKPYSVLFVRTRIRYWFVPPKPLYLKHKGQYGVTDIWCFIRILNRACDISIIQKAHIRRREQALVLKMKFLCSFRTINFINLNFSEFSLSSYFHYNSIY